MSLYGCYDQYWCYHDPDTGETRCYVSAQSVYGTILSLENTLDVGGVITKFCVDAWGAMWGENGWNGLDFYVNLKVFRKVGDTLKFVGESGPKHVKTADRHWIWGYWGWYLGFDEGDYIEGPITFDCFIPGVKKGDIIGLAGVDYYPGMWGYVYVTEENNPNNLRHTGSVATDTPLSEWVHHYCGRWSVSVDIGIPQGVSGWLCFPDDARTPLFNAKVSITMYHLNDNGDFDYYYDFPPVYTNKLGWFWLDTTGNPFDFFSWDYWEFLIWGWNRVSLKIDMCNGQQLCRSGIVFANNYAQVDLTYPVRITHRLKVKDASTGNLLPGVITVYIDGYNMDSVQLTDSNGISEWKDAHPLLITNIVSSDIYAGRTLSIDRRGIDVLNACWQETEVLLNPLSLGKEVYFDKPEYHPEETMHIGFDTDSTANCKVRLFDAHGYKVLEQQLGSQFVSPPTVDYTIPSRIFYGIYVAQLLDQGDIGLASAWVYVGTKGNVSHDISKLCTDKLVLINYDNIDPIFKPGIPPNNMKVELYDGTKDLIGTWIVQNGGGTFSYTVLGTEYIQKPWVVKLIDQWGNLVDADSISVFGCKQTILGRVRRPNGNPVKLCWETLDLGFMGFGVIKVQTDTEGRFTFTKIPPFPETDLKSYKPRYMKNITQVSLGEDELRMVDITLEGLLKGVVTDEENKPVANAYVILEGGDTIYDVVDMTRDDGNYDVPPLTTGPQKLRFMKNNFNVEEITINIPEISENALQTIKDRQLTRRALELFDANFRKTNVAFETSLVQLDQVDIQNIPAGIMELTNSGQKIALIEVIAGGGGSHNTGIGPYGEGDVSCEYYGDDENGVPIIRCSYVNRLTI